MFQTSLFILAVLLIGSRGLYLQPTPLQCPKTQEVVTEDTNVQVTHVKVLGTVTTTVSVHLVTTVYQTSVFQVTSISFTTHTVPAELLTVKVLRFL